MHVRHEAQRMAIIRGDPTNFQLPSPPSHDRFKVINTWRTIQKPSKFRLQMQPHG